MGRGNQGASCPQGHGDGYRLVRFGRKTVGTEVRQRWRCLAADGSAHLFYTVIGSTAAARPNRRRVLCPKASHADGVVQSRGTRVDSRGTWRRYLCRRPNGDEHSFRLLVSPAGAGRVVDAPPPPCPEHDHSRVVRWGTFRAPVSDPSSDAVRTPRQRYRCYPLDGSPVHSFSPALTREVVSPGSSCSACDELLSPHRGALTASRHTPWTLRGVVQALNDLSIGQSYSSVSLAMREHRDRALHHLAAVHGVEMRTESQLQVNEDAPDMSSNSYRRKQARNAWHLAANLVEQYAPVLWDHTMSRIEAQEIRQRELNDDFLRRNPGRRLSQPIVYLLDELPVFLAPSKGAQASLQSNSWSILVVASIQWKPAERGRSLPTRDVKLRLARAYPRGSADAWKLVLNELPVAPDFVIADASEAIRIAVSDYYQNEIVIIPSMFHVMRNIQEPLMAIKAATTTNNGRVELIAPLAKHLGLLSRDDIMTMSVRDLGNWWDHLVYLVSQVPAPVAQINNKRKFYEQRIADALPVLQANPQLPASNAGVEARIRTNLAPLMEARKYLFRNLTRTNFLLDLATVRDNGGFTNLDALAALIRTNNEESGGWAAKPRAVGDKQPMAGLPGVRPMRYSSLLNPGLVPALMKARGLDQ